MEMETDNTYDAAGNQTAYIHGGDPTHRMSWVATYDAAGNQTAYIHSCNPADIGSWVATYNEQGCRTSRVYSGNPADSDSWRYEYANGLIVAKIYGANEANQGGATRRTGNENKNRNQ